MNNKIIGEIQKRVVGLLPAELQDRPGLFLADSCSEVSRLVAGWLKKLDQSMKILILKGVGVCNTDRQHDILAVIDNQTRVQIIDSTVWQFFPNDNSILICEAKNIDDAIGQVAEKYGGKWQIGTEIAQLSEIEENVYLNVVARNVTEIITEHKAKIIMSKMYFISGVNGVGKSTIIPYLKELLPGDKFEIHDFDERGVPANAGGGWRISETKYWFEEGVKLTQKNKCIVICGFVKPADFEDMLKDKDLDIKLILLDAAPEVIKRRLINRYSVDGYFDESQTVIGKPINVFIDGNLYILSQMRMMFEELGCQIVDTSILLPDKVAEKVVDIILALL